MRIIAVSDTHGNFRALESVVMRNTDADWIIHLGDGERDIDQLFLAHPEIQQKLLRISGNCDSGISSFPFFVLDVPGHRIFATHGHLYAVKNSLEIIKRQAKANDCDIILFGHTHVRYNKFEDGFYIFNPGSASCPHDGTKPSFGHIDISPAGVVMNIAEV